MPALLNLALQLIELLRQVPEHLRAKVYAALAALATIALLVVCLPFTRDWFGLQHAPPAAVILVGVFNFLIALSGLLARANVTAQKPAARTRPRTRRLRR